MITKVFFSLKTIQNINTLMAGLTFVLEPMCSRSEPLVHSLCGDGPRLTLTPQGRS